MSSEWLWLIVSVAIVAVCLTGFTLAFRRLDISTANVKRNADRDTLAERVERLLPAILQVESGGRLDVPDGAAGERGPYQITRAAWEDAVEWGGWTIDDGRWTILHRQTFEAGAHDPLAARVAIFGYMMRWGEHYERKQLQPATYEVLARIYNGGPHGWLKPATREYWEKVKAAMK